jgi:molybdopterin converting factor small subunit
MKVKVRLFGLLSEHVADYDHTRGIDLDVHEGTTYRDLTHALQLSLREAGIFATGGTLKRPDDYVGDGEEVHIFMPIGGG